MIWETLRAKLGDYFTGRNISAENFTGLILREHDFFSRGNDGGGRDDTVL